MEQRPARPAGTAGNRGGQRLPRTIRFTDHDWDRIETFAVMRGMTAPELVRTAAIAAVGGGASRGRCRRPAGSAGRPDLPVHAHPGDRFAERDDRERPRGGAGRAGPLGPRAARRAAGRPFGLSSPAVGRGIPGAIPSPKWQGSGPVALPGPVRHERACGPLHVASLPAAMPIGTVDAGQWDLTWFLEVRGLRRKVPNA